MTRILALDTSTWWCGVALLLQSAPGRVEVVAELRELEERSHAPGLLGRVDAVLAEAGWTKRQIDGFVAVRGPGSFTGVRVGLGVALGLAVGSGRPCFGVTSLEAVAEAHGPADRDRVPLIGAGRDEVYGARYDPASSPPEEIVPPWVGPARRAGGESGALLICAPGAADPVAAAGFDPDRYPRVDTARSTAAAAGRLALLGRALESEAGRPLSPLYVRPPDAEIKSGLSSR